MNEFLAVLVQNELIFPYGLKYSARAFVRLPPSPFYFSMATKASAFCIPSVTVMVTDSRTRTTASARP